MMLADTQPGQVARYGTWIYFQSLSKPLERKTPIFAVVAKEGAGQLGVIQWWGAWRKYAFFPNPDTLYEPKCLKEITQFLNDLMVERRQ